MPEEMTPPGPEDRSVFDRPLVTAAEMDRMTPEELDRLHDERFVTDLSRIPAEVLDDLLGDDAEVIARARESDRRWDAAAERRTSRAS